MGTQGDKEIGGCFLLVLGLIGLLVANYTSSTTRWITTVVSVGLSAFGISIVYKVRRDWKRRHNK